MPSVLSHLAHLLASHPENVATEALGFILDRSEPARRGFLQLLSTVGLRLDAPLRFRTQVPDETGARPDLVGETTDGEVRVLVEAKFWAGLAPPQPVGYLETLPERDALLLFVAPSKRLSTLWLELVKRLREAGFDVVEVTTHLAESRVARVDDRLFGLVSWRSLLLGLKAAADQAGDIEAAGDIHQLSGLCESMDSEAFLPLTSEELTSNLGRRVIQFGDLVNDLTNLLVAEGYANVKGLRATGGNGWYGRYLLLGGHGAFLQFASNSWAERGISPLWLRVIGPNWKISPQVREALVRGGVRGFEDSDGYQVPVELVLGAEREAVLNRAKEQIINVANLLRAIVTSGELADPPPEFTDGSASHTPTISGPE